MGRQPHQGWGSPGDAASARRDADCRKPPGNGHCRAAAARRKYGSDRGLNNFFRLYRSGYARSGLPSPLGMHWPRKEAAGGGLPSPRPEKPARLGVGDQAGQARRGYILPVRRRMESGGGLIPLLFRPGLYYLEHFPDIRTFTPGGASFKIAPFQAISRALIGADGS